MMATKKQLRNKRKNERKSELLGMPYGTAANRLRKKVLFHLLVKYEQNICFRCGDPIETAAELSLEHIVPWQVDDSERAQELFWDENNCAFSHLGCNSRAASRKATAKISSEMFKKVGPKGTAWCCGCQDFLVVENFGKGKRDGLRQYCKECTRKAQATWNRK